MHNTMTQRRVAQGLELRGRIVDAACALMAQGGYGGCALAEVAQQAGATKNQLMHHFGSKERLGLAVVERLLKAWHDELLAPVALYPDPSEQLRRLLLQLDSLGAGGWGHGRLLLALALESPRLPQAVREALLAALQELRRGFSAPLKLLREGGAALAEQRPRALATVLLGAALGTAALGLLGEAGEAPPAVQPLLGRLLPGG
jgi:AcrR family transcriptional regulator